MNSDMPKCAHKIIDYSMIEYVIDAINDSGISNVYTVIGYRGEEIKNILKSRSKYVFQEHQLGTAHAVLMAEKYLKNEIGNTLIAIGDMPFISKETYSDLIKAHLDAKVDLTVLSTDHPNPFGYGRIVRDNLGFIQGIVEEKDCTDVQKSIQEINASIYLVDNKKLFESIEEIKNNNRQNEYYLTDIVKIFKEKNYIVNVHKGSNYKEISGINDIVQLRQMEEMIKEATINKHLKNGVIINNPQLVTIGKNVQIGENTIINGRVTITSNSKIGNNCNIGPEVNINNSNIKDGTKLSNVTLNNNIKDD